MTRTNDADVSILLVDDDEETINLLTDFLEESFKDISFAMNGEDALLRAEEGNPDLVLVDIGLPDHSGYEVCRKIRANDDIPVLFITGRNEPQAVKEAFESGGVDYVTKPLQKEEIIARVDRILELYAYRENLERKVRERTEELREKNESLRRTNQALEEVLDRVEQREKNTWRKISRQIETLVEPQLQKLQLNVRDDLKEQVSLIEEHLEEVFEGKGEEFSDLRTELSSREFEVCSYIRKGLTSKEIASTLGRSVSTVKNHRRNIRKKLDLTNEDLSLKEFLQQNF
jgi:DNA-binding NarL/FixJ family response regulator